MEKLRQKFWTESKKLINWCTDEELRVLRIMAAKRMEERLIKHEQKIFEGENNAVSKRKPNSKKRAGAKNA